ncbi:MarR family winged helix-turn-helix transcriptional regulator [Nocardia pseudobrasiliensis]|uniref:DNA-binding MarR family transcriptional regulator n=1 Tax=Nocardia pseudobrasiliensis TaxID=45979 RepID=A0A370IET5_9NOCA|nr:MarR family transcriptional regulator [Nocardia pseudobrasiliensis]RDI69238.1 DNA-binding MarR family transcriptional regulator [Nocardia pseudobrasiliensis]
MAQEATEKQDGLAFGREFAAAMVNFHAATGKLLGLSASERKCMDTLDRLGSVTAGAIAEHTGLTTGAVTGLVDRLEKSGYARRVRDPHDRRKVLVELVPNAESRALLGAVFAPFGEDMSELYERYTPEQNAAILDWVRRTTEILIDHTRRISAPEFRATVLEGR